MKTTISGIPCLIHILDRGVSPSKAHSHWDCEPIWEVHDRNGNKAAWLESKLSPEESRRITSAVIEYLYGDDYK